MRTRVIGIPDASGIVRVSCGGDEIEILIVTPGSGRDDPETHPDAGVFDKPGTANVFLPIGGDPFSIPGSYIQGRSDADGRLDVDSVVAAVLKRFENPDADDPGAVMLNASGINLHELARLGERLGRTAPGLRLAVDFAGPLDRE